MNLVLALTLIGIVFAVCAELYYIRKIYLKKVRLSLSGFVVFFLSALVGGGSTVEMSGLMAGAVPLSFASLQLWMLWAAYKTRFNSGWDKVDSLLILAVICSGILWYFFDAPIIALGCALFVDFVSYLSVVRKMSRFPRSEDVFAWFLAFAAYVSSLIVAWVRHGSLDSYALSLLNAFGCIAIVAYEVTQKHSPQHNVTKIP